MYRSEEVDRLKSRVGFLDRWRHVLAVITAIGGSYAMKLDIEWSPTAVIVMFVVMGGLIWWGVECAIAGALAIWETRMFRLARDRGVPPARLLRRK